MGRRIVVVEDERITAHFIQMTLETLGHFCVGIADSFEGALEVVSLHKPDLALVDIAIKGHRDGIDLAHRLLQTHAIPTLFVTAHHDEETLHRALPCNPGGFLVKPFDEDDLKVAIKMALNHHCPLPARPERVAIGGGFVLDLEGDRLLRSGMEVALTKKEMLLLRLLHKKAGEVVDYATLQSRIWRGETMNLNSLRNLINGLRSKLHGIMIENVKGMGYRLNA